MVYIELIVSFLLGASILAGYVLIYSRLHWWKMRYQSMADERKLVLESLVNNVKDLQLERDKFTSLTEYIKIQSERPVVAAIQEKHVQEIAGMLASLIQQNMVNRLN